MKTIRSSAEMARALASPLDVDLKRLLAVRCDQLSEYEGYDLGELASFVIAEPGDPPSAIRAALGFSPFVNAVDGKAYGEPGFEPSWETIDEADGWFELVFVFTDDGFGHVLAVPDQEGVDPELLQLCRAYT